MQVLVYWAVTRCTGAFATSEMTLNIEHDLLAKPSESHDMHLIVTLVVCTGWFVKNTLNLCGSIH